MGLRVFAVGAHPDDIEFMMGGTLLSLAERGAELHYLHLASGSCGTMTLPPGEIVAIRREESRRAAALLGAVYHESLVDDLGIYYRDNLIRRLAAIVRRIRPDCVLLPSPIDYMEDHQNTARVGATATFCRGVPNYRTIPHVDAVDGETAVYHAMPYGLAGPLGERIDPEFVVDVSDLETKRLELLECHASQRDWLDSSQGIGSYTDAMLEMSASLAACAGRTGHVEGWRRRSHLGYCAPDYRPLEAVLAGIVCSFAPRTP